MKLRSVLIYSNEFSSRELCVDTVKWNHRFEEKLSDKVKEKRLLFCHEFKRRTRIVLSNVGQGRTGGGLVGK